MIGLVDLSGMKRLQYLKEKPDYKELFLKTNNSFYTSHAYILRMQNACLISDPIIIYQALIVLLSDVRFSLINSNNNDSIDLI